MRCTKIARIMPCPAGRHGRDVIDHRGACGTSSSMRIDRLMAQLTHPSVTLEDSEAHTLPCEPAVLRKGHRNNERKPTTARMPTSTIRNQPWTSVMRPSLHLQLGLATDERRARARDTPEVPAGLQVQRLHDR